MTSKSVQTVSAVSGSVVMFISGFAVQKTLDPLSAFAVGFIGLMVGYFLSVVLMKKFFMVD